jgi:3-hydroxyisobutyrate dehydrogenase
MKIGFIGVGVMGSAMAGTLSRFGHDVTVFDANRERMAEVASQHGVAQAAGPGDIAENEVVICMLPNGSIVREVLTETDQGAFAKRVKPGTIVIDMSSSDPLGTVELGRKLAERGVALIDSPVAKRDNVFTAKGGNLQVRDERLSMTLMIGGDDKAALKKVKPVLELLGEALFETGALGTGHATKALNNYSSAAAMVVLGEVLRVGARYGLDPAILVDVINESTGRSFSSEAIIKHAVRDEDFVVGFATGLMAKDVRIASTMAKSCNMEVPVAKLVENHWNLAEDLLGSNSDMAQARRAWVQKLP